MKKLLSVVLVLSFCLCLGGCVLPRDSGTQNCISGNPGSYVITLPKTGQTIDVGADEEIYLEKVTDKLVADAEKVILEKCDEDERFYLRAQNGYLYLCVEVIVEKEPVGEDLSDHEHVFHIEKISRK